MHFLSPLVLLICVKSRQRCFCRQPERRTRFLERLSFVSHLAFTQASFCSVAVVRSGTEAHALRDRFMRVVAQVAQREFRIQVSAHRQYFVVSAWPLRLVIDWEADAVQTFLRISKKVGSLLIHS